MERSENIPEIKQDESELRRAYHSLEIAHRELQESFLKIQHLARIDELTGANNRRSLIELMEQEFKVAMRYGAPLSVIMFDIDDFKQINDSFGHIVGDRVLQNLTQVVRSKLRSADVIGRYGGDEFVILCPHTNAQEALLVAERINDISGSILLETSKGPLTITISIGIAQTAHSNLPSSDKFDTLENLLQCADQALYASKKAGKNRTVIFGSE